MKIVLILTLISLFGCASVTPGTSAIQTYPEGNQENEIGVTSFVDDELSSDNYKIVNIYFNNQSNNWLRVKNIEIESFSDNKTADILVGKDLQTWAKSTSEQVAVSRYNTNMLLGGIGAVALGASRFSSNTNTQIAGLAVGVSTLGYLSVKEIMQQINDNERASLIPEEHLLTPFSIPVNLTTKKWIVFSKTKDAWPCHFILKIQMIDETIKKYNINLNSCSVNLR